MLGQFSILILLISSITIILAYYDIKRVSNVYSVSFYEPLWKVSNNTNKSKLIQELNSYHNYINEMSLKYNISPQQIKYILKQNNYNMNISSYFDNHKVSETQSDSNKVRTYKYNVQYIW
jgi:hypothetical protein